MANEPDNKGEGTSSSEDPIKQIKSEFARKTENLTQTLAAQNARIEQLMQAVIQQQNQRSEPPPRRETEPEIDPYQDPKGYRKQVAAQAVAEARQAAADQAQQAALSQQEQNTALSALLVDYPELNDRTSELYAKAMEYANALPQGQRNTGVGLKAAVRDAAADLGIQSIKHRVKKDSSNDDFTVDSGSSKGKSSSSENRSRSEKLPQEMLEFAALLGRPVDDPKYIERLKGHANRKNWNRYK